MDKQELKKAIHKCVREQEKAEKNKPERLTTPIFTHTGKRTFRY